MEWTNREKLALFSAVKKWGPKILENPDLAKHLNKFEKNRPYDWFNMDNCIHMYKEICLQFYSDDIDKNIRKLEQNHLNELKQSLYNRFEMIKDINNKIRIQKEKIIEKKKRNSNENIVPEINDDNNKLTTEIVEVVPEMIEKSIEMDVQPQIDNDFVKEKDSNENENLPSQSEDIVESNDDDDEKIDHDVDTIENIDEIMKSESDDDNDDDVDKNTKSINDQTEQTSVDEKIESIHEDENVQSIETETIDESNQNENIDESIENIKSDNDDISHTTTDDVIIPAVEESNDDVNDDDDNDSTLIVKKESKTYATKNNIQKSEQYSQQSKSTRMITRSISRQSIQLEMVDSKESLNLSKSVSFIDLIDSIENDNQPTTIVEKQIDQQQLVDDDDDDIEKQSKEQVEEQENISKTETNLEQEISIDNKSETMINEKPTVINQRSKQPKTNDDTQQPKEIIKDNKKREKSQSKDTEEFNIITRSTSKKIAKQTKSPPLPPPVVDVIPTRSNHRSKSMSLETKITSSPTLSSPSPSTITSISDTKEIDIIMARKLRNIVKSIGKHDYFDYLKRLQSSSQSSLNDVIEKPINIENIMIEIDNGNIDSLIQLKHRLILSIFEYQIQHQQTMMDSLNDRKKFLEFLTDFEKKFTINIISNENSRKKNQDDGKQCPDRRQSIQ
ncbi:uncharacterized protein LOC113796914 [Dermatophagoides pteronyssinus]|uniref:uncharacterized protein LOC113796914 n=1 Tax=Dermatophagoides pteronyssinus TaxID=6956 RepID=UPI003F6731C5